MACAVGLPSTFIRARIERTAREQEVIRISVLRANGNFVVEIEKETKGRNGERFLRWLVYTGYLCLPSNSTRPITALMFALNFKRVPPFEIILIIIINFTSFLTNTLDIRLHRKCFKIRI